MGIAPISELGSENSPSSPIQTLFSGRDLPGRPALRATTAAGRAAIAPADRRYRDVVAEVIDQDVAPMRAGQDAGERNPARAVLPHIAKRHHRSAILSSARLTPAAAQATIVQRKRRRASSRSGGHSIGSRSPIHSPCPFLSAAKRSQPGVAILFLFCSHIRAFLESAQARDRGATGEHRHE